MKNQPSLVNISLSKTIQAVLNTAIRLDEEQGSAFFALEGKVIQLNLIPIESPLYILFTHSMVSVQPQLSGDADAIINSTLIDFASLPIRHKLSPTAIHNDKLVGQQFIDALERLEIDWEEYLSHYTGDLIAFKVGHRIRSFFTSQRVQRQSIGDMLREYLQFEINCLPTKYQATQFHTDVNTTVAELKVLESRMNTLILHKITKR